MFGFVLDRAQCPQREVFIGFNSRSLVVFQVLCYSFQMSCEIVLVSVLKICVLCQGQLYLSKCTENSMGNVNTEF